MREWMDWLEIQKHNDWGVRSRTDGTAELWNRAADRWADWSEDEIDFARRQVEALDIQFGDTVIDICCGAGPLTLWLAKRAKHVIAFDYGENMLAHVKKNAEKEGLNNITCIQGNWYSMEPGVDFPKADIAVTRHSPAHADILKFSRCAEKYCYSLWNCAPASPGGTPKMPRGGRWIRSENEEENTGPRPDGRKYGYNVHFNILYDRGADPELRYVKSKRMMPDGTVRTVKMSILGWDPNSLTDI